MADDRKDNDFMLVGRQKQDEQKYTLGKEQTKAYLGKEATKDYLGKEATGRSLMKEDKLGISKELMRSIDGREDSFKLRGIADLGSPEKKTPFADTRRQVYGGGGKSRLTPAKNFFSFGRHGPFSNSHKQFSVLSSRFAKAAVGNIHKFGHQFGLHGSLNRVGPSTIQGLS